MNDFMSNPDEIADAFCKRYPEAVAGGGDKVKGGIRWVVVTIFKDVTSCVVTIIAIIGLLVIALAIYPDYFDMLFLPIVIIVSLIITILEILIYGKCKDQ